MFGFAPMSVLYRYALDKNASIIEIDGIPQNLEGGVFRCISCGQEMIPRRGMKNRHHFAHKSESACSKETYLHKMAKELICTTIKKHFLTRKPFLLAYPVREKCVSNAGLIPAFECSTRSFRTIDLSKVFDLAETEREAGGFRADILLRSSVDRQKRLLIEVAVNHRCSEAKKRSGLPIVELNLESEEAVEKIASGFIDARWEHPRVSTYNFNDVRLTNKCSGACVQGRKVTVFMAFKNGRQIIKEVDLWTLRRLQGNDDIRFIKWFSVWEESNWKALVDEGRKLGVVLRNCRNCKHFEIVEDGQSRILYCSEVGPIKSSRRGMGCSMFFPSPEMDREHSQ